MRQREKTMQEELEAAHHSQQEFERGRDMVTEQLEQFKDQVEMEQQAYKDARAENEVYSEQVKRLEMAVFEADMRRKDATEKSKAKLRSVMAEKDNISSAYLKT